MEGARLASRGLEGGGGVDYTGYGISGFPIWKGMG
jgi:hypothetical protein